MVGSVLTFAPPASASIAFGSINNFDTVNDTGNVCHGFEIEIDGIHSKDITYTYDYNHYGVPRITEDLTDTLHPECSSATRAPRIPTEGGLRSLPFRPDRSPPPMVTSSSIPPSISAANTSAWAFTAHPPPFNIPPLFAPAGGELHF